MKFKIQSKKRFAVFIALILLIPISLGYLAYRYFTAPTAIALENVSNEQKTELIGTVFSRDLEIFKFADIQNEKKQTGDVTLTTFDEKTTGSKETQFIFPEKYQDGYKFIQDGIEVTMKPKNIDISPYQRKVSSIAEFEDEKKTNTGQFISYEKEAEKRFIPSGSQEKHLFALSRDNNTLKQWSLYSEYKDEITEEWEFQNAYIKKTDDGSIEVYKAPIKKESEDTMKNLEPSMAERISATLKEEMGDDYYFQDRNLLFTIPKPYLITKNGENKDADTEIQNQNILTIKVKAQKDEFPILLDPTITLAAKMDNFQINGDSGGDYLGLSVSDAGDVNGDGKEDVIVGALYDDDNGSLSGSAFIFYGGMLTSGTGAATAKANVKLTGDIANDYFGVSVSGAGDVNGDGKDDVIVGSQNNSGGGSAYIFYGVVASGTASTVADVKITGDSAGGQFGISVSGAGDVNGDGLDDVIVGTNGANSAFIFYGGVVSGTASVVANVKITADNGLSAFGYSVSGAGDVNGDGKDDVIVGHPGGNVTFIFYGGVTSGSATNQASVKLTADEVGDSFGVSVSGAGDVNGDGKDDVIVGARDDDDGGNSSGSAFIFYGGVVSGSASTVANVKITGDSANDKFGASVSGAGDINGDGKDDVIVGAPYDDDNSRSDSGSTFIYYGGVVSGSATSVANIKFSGDSADDYFGYSVSGAGDVNSDGKDDVIVGAYADDNGGNGTGSAKIYTFNDFQNSAKLVGDSAGDQLGYSVSGAGDVNGDGKDDVIVGAPYDDDGGNDSGSAFIFYGGVVSGTASAVADVKITGDSASDNFGNSVSGAGDMNGDGKDDVIVGAPENDDIMSNNGAAYIFYGGMVSGTASTLSNVKITGDNGEWGDHFGYSVSGAGDVNGDGKDDVIVGATWAFGSDYSGAAYIFYGGVTSGVASAKANVKITGDAREDQFGWSVSGAGDVNGDGKDDVIVGSYASSAYKGAAYIFYGGFSSGAATTKANVKITGDSASDFFGYSVSGAGDVNGDGKDDIIVGATGYSTDNGAAYIFYGGVTSGSATTKANVKLTGDSASDYFGTSVSGAGDVNGDGKADVIVGAYQDDDNGSNSGSAFIFYGGVTSGVATTKANVKLTGDSASDSFGFSVSGTGDVNGDGKDDVIVGAHFDDDNGASSGSAFIFTQGPSGEMQKYNGESAGDNFGYSVSSAGDMDGDGLDDVIVGAPYNNSSAGAAYIFYGNKITGTAAMSYDIKITGDSADDKFGYSVSGADDVNGDGKDDVIVGAPYDDDGGSDTGSAFIFYGGVVSGTASAVANVKLTGDSANDYFGNSVSDAGDMNGDGKDDLIVGAFWDDDGGSDSGSTFIFYGGVTSGAATTKADIKLTGDSANDYFGNSVSSADDVNGDGKDDVIVGAPYDNEPGSDSGSAFIFYGGVTSGSATTQSSVKLTGDSANDYFGTSVSDAGDMNGDGKDDVIVGASGDDDNGSDSGSAFIFYGGVTSGSATTQSSVKLTGDSADDSFGNSVSGAGDVNGDGKSDILVGAGGDSDNGSGSGSAFIFYGGMVSGTSTIVSGTATQLADVKILGDSSDDNFGASVSGAGDVNGDGKADIIVGAYQDDDGGSNSGSVKIIIDLATKDNPDSPNFQLNGDSASDQFGISVSDAGDVNGDGKDDVILGAPYDDDNGSNSGSAFIFYGGVTSGAATNRANVKLTGDSASDYFGYSVSGAGDVNGDGKDDVIVGAPYDDDNGSDSGSAFIFYGGVTSGLATTKANVKLTGDSASDNLGRSVSGAGYLNGDGKSDVIVGASRDDDNGSDSGSAFIFYGGVTSGSATTRANVKLTGDDAYDFFGRSVSGAGDVNGDGKDDIVVGACDIDTMDGFNSVYLFYGGVTSGIATNKASVKIIGDNNWDSFGASVSGAGDVNGDGKDDIIAGAESYPSSGYVGAVYIFYGGVVSGSATTKASVKLSGDSENDYFGSSVSGAGDVNGDGKDDVIVGASRDDDNGSASGSAFIFYGGVTSGSATTQSNVKLNGDSASDYFGYSVSGAGDVNGDGKADVIVGAYQDDDNGSNSGSARIIYGHRISPEMPTNFTPVSGTYNYGQSISAVCSGGTYNTNQDKYGQTIVWDMESFYAGGWHEVVSADADGSYSYSVNSVPNGSGLKLRCRNEIDGLLGGFSPWYEPFGIDLSVIQGKEKIEGGAKFEGSVKME